MQKIPILYSSFLFYISLQPISPITLDPGPTYGKDYSGLDYNVTPWNSPQSKSPNHWEAAALECQALCIADPNCCSWTYCTPEAGPSDPERCCLKKWYSNRKLCTNPLDWSSKRCNTTMSQSTSTTLSWPTTSYSKSNKSCSMCSNTKLA